MKRIVTVCLAAGMLTGCAGIGVDPWDRGVLARADAVSVAAAAAATDGMNSGLPGK